MAASFMQKIYCSNLTGCNKLSYPPYYLITSRYRDNIKMTAKYYLKHILWGLIPVFIMIHEWATQPHTEKLLITLTLSIINAALYPLSIKAVQNIVFSFVKKEFWERDFFTNSVGGSLQAILFIFCFIAAIPFAIVFIIQSNSPSHHK